MNSITGTSLTIVRTCTLIRRNYRLESEGQSPKQYKFLKRFIKVTRFCIPLVSRKLFFLVRKFAVVLKNLGELFMSVLLMRYEMQMVLRSIKGRISPQICFFNNRYFLMSFEF